MSLAYELQIDFSESYQADETPMRLWCPLGPEVDGNLSYDTLFLTDELRIQDFPFVELKHSKWYDYQYDGQIALAPQHTYPLLDPPGMCYEGQPHTPSVYTRLVGDNLLEEPVFSLLLPSERGRVGDLSFGTAHIDLYHGELIPHPIFPRNATSWQVEAPDISIVAVNGTTLFRQSLTGIPL